MQLRQDLAQHLRDTMADVGIATANTTVYDAGVDIIDVPAIVINPSDPYLAVITMKQTAITANLRLHLITNRNDPETSFDMLEDMRKMVTDSLKTNKPAARWSVFGGFGLTEVGGVGYATAVLEITMRATDE